MISQANELEEWSQFMMERRVVNGIHEFQPWTLNTEHWTLNTERWTLNAEHWTLNTEHWTLWSIWCRIMNIWSKLHQFKNMKYNSLALLCQFISVFQFSYAMCNVQCARGLCLSLRKELNPLQSYYVMLMKLIIINENWTEFCWTENLTAKKKIVSSKKNDANLWTNNKFKWNCCCYVMSIMLMLLKLGSYNFYIKFNSTKTLWWAQMMLCWWSF